MKIAGGTIKWLAAGAAFAVLWGSASTATKIALAAAQPLVIAITRFAIASASMLFIAHVVLKRQMPKKGQWKQLAFYGLLNISVYLGIYVFAMKFVTAGVGALTVAINPVFISFFSLIFLKKPVSTQIIVSLLIGLAGIFVVAIPLFADAHVTWTGLALLVTSMVSYSAGNIYFSSKKWEGLQIIVINGWQTLFGGLFLFPLVALSYKPAANNFDMNFWSGVTWLAIPVSVIAVAFWIWLLQRDTVKAGMWLFLSPVFGILTANIFVGDEINIYTAAGLLMVLGGLAYSHFKPGRMQQIE